MSGVAEAVLRCHRHTTVGALALLVLAAWGWIVAGAGMGMAARAEFLLFPHRAAGMAMAMPWDGGRIAVTLLMWWVMMIAMMVPAAAPVVLLYARAAPAQRVAPRPGAFLAGYLVAWLSFSAVAVALQFLLERAELLSAMSMSATDRWLASGVLVAAGLYQFAPLKDSCLSHCRNPAEFIARHFRPGPLGALRMGVIHGAFCVGCCWMLMALLFVVGVMNLAWIALLTLVVAGEKLLPKGRILSRAAGALFLAWGGASLLLG